MKISQSICIENQVTGSNVIGASIGNGRPLNPSRPNPRRREKYKLNFYFNFKQLFEMHRMGRVNFK